MTYRVYWMRYGAASPGSGGVYKGVLQAELRSLVEELECRGYRVRVEVEAA